MKMLLAIINYDDSQSVIAALTKEGFSVTRLATTGGFLKSGNVTVLIGLDESRLDDAFQIIRDHCRKRKQIVPTTTELGMGFFPTMPVQVEVGGATVFVLGVERFEKL
ncbi:MAG: transcriptional regulator [Clostridiaceae bacterium]|nr:transcriptional regulator [Clostridiaceae bacterium]MCI9484755.1 transcriptional regulator [Clostridiaceae bacterium]NBH78062.1 transcriptional regulator [Clostridiaceae bacterium]NBI84299.1 transcriptional regulator [Clostridiaceae bacterium]RKJ73061.1 transcriptional regulator [Butyricicoccus sp. 1XD8-22]